MTNEISMEITRSNNALSSVKVIMPTWNKVENGITQIHIPVFGINTCAKNEIDAEVAIKEAVTIYCLAAEQFGLGLESELEYMGWEQEVNNEKEHSLMNVKESDNEIFNNIMQTGEMQLLELSLA